MLRMPRLNLKGQQESKSEILKRHKVNYLSAFDDAMVGPLL
jgi:hypothetical protein